MQYHAKRNKLLLPYFFLLFIYYFAAILTLSLLVEVIDYVTFHWMTCGIMRLATLQLASKLQKCIRMGIPIFKIFFWGSISSGIRSEITFYGSAYASP